MEKTAGKRGRPATGPSSTMMRIPYALKPAIEELVAHYRQARVKAWEAALLRETGAKEQESAP